MSEGLPLATALTGGHALIGSKQQRRRRGKRLMSLGFSDAREDAVLTKAYVVNVGRAGFGDGRIKIVCEGRLRRHRLNHSGPGESA